MGLLILGLVVFLAIHQIPTQPALKEQLSERLGALGYRALFSLISLLGLALIVYGYGVARAADPLIVFDPPQGLRHLTMLLVAIAFVLLAASLFPGRIAEKVKHPMVTAVKVWAFAHLLVNGDLPSLVLFGTLLAWAVYDRISLKRRVAAGTASISTGPLRNDVIALVVGLGAYGLFVWQLHTMLIGVPILP